MSIQSINWVNARNQTLPVKYDTEDKLNPKTIDDKLKVVRNIYKKTDFSTVDAAAVFRNEASKHIDGVLFEKNGNRQSFYSGTSSEGPGVAQVLTGMAKALTPVSFAGKKAKAPTQPPAKQPLSLMA